MKIAVIGTGHVGGALAKGLAQAGHDVVLGARDSGSEKVKALLAARVTAASVRDAAQSADVIIIAAPPEATRGIVDAMGNVCGKVIIDAMNSVRTRAGDFASTSEALRAWTGSQDVVKCFNSVGYNIMADPLFGNTAADMFVAGSSTGGKELATRLAKDLGFGSVYDFGGDDKIHLLEAFALLWINLAMVQGQGREIAFKLLKR